MGKVAGRKDAVPLEEVVVAQAYELEVLMNVLERRRLIAKAEVLEEIKWRRAQAPKAR